MCFQFIQFPYDCVDQKSYSVSYSKLEYPFDGNTKYYQQQLL